MLRNVKVGKGLSELCTAWIYQKDFFIDILLTEIYMFFQVIANTLLLLSANVIGYFYQFMSSKSQKRTFEQIRSTVESRVKLECEKEHQEQLLLSVIPAYIAAEVSNYALCCRLNNLWYSFTLAQWTSRQGIAWNQGSFTIYIDRKQGGRD